VPVSLCNRNYLNHEFEAKHSITLFGYSLINILSSLWLLIYKIRILNEESSSLVKLVVFAVNLTCYMIVVWKISHKIMKFTAIVSMKFVHVSLSNAMRLLFRTGTSHKQWQRAYTAIVSMWFIHVSLPNAASTCITVVRRISLTKQWNTL